MNKFFNIFLILVGISIPLSAQEVDPEMFRELFPDLEISEDLEYSPSKDVDEPNQATRKLKKENEQDFNSNQTKKKEKIFKYDAYGSIIPEIFGRNLFENENNAKALYTSTAPRDYILGPGDELTLNFTGKKGVSRNVIIDGEGLIFIKEIGSVNLSGLTYEKAQKYINNLVKASLIGTSIDISLSKLRPISIYVVGNINFPGTYVLNPLSSVINALYASGGPSESGSMRNISLKRSNEIIDNIDLYDLFILGNSSVRTKIQSGDVLLVNPVNKYIKIFGEVRRPAIYELVEEERFVDILNFASGFTSLANRKKITLSRNGGDSLVKQVLSLEQLKKLELRDGDQIYIHTSKINRPDANNDQINQITLSGEFVNPGVYSFEEGDTLLDLINRAGGYTEEAYPLGGVFLRKEVALREKEAFERAAREIETSLMSAVTSGQLSEIGDTELAIRLVREFLFRLRSAKPVGRIVSEFELERIKEFSSFNFILANGDKVHMPKKEFSITVTGEVLSPMSFTFNSALDFKDYINLAGGFKDDADRDNAFLILPNGQTARPHGGWFRSNNLIKPGTTIIVSRDTSKLSQIALWKVVLPIFSNLIQTLAALESLSD
jgi:protein involved in polysaccharide export with SLBB domain